MRMHNRAAAQLDCGGAPPYRTPVGDEEPMTGNPRGRLIGAGPFRGTVDERNASAMPGHTNRRGRMHPCRNRASARESGDGG